MTIETAIMLLLIAATFVVFALELFPIEVTALGMLAVLIVLGFVTPTDAVQGFSNKAVVTIGGLFVLSRALVKTGILELGAFYLSQKVGSRKWLGLAVFLAAAGFLSGFLNNTAVVAVLIPLAMSLCRRLSLSPTRVMLPLSYIAILGGLLTVIGTSTNLLVSSLAERAGEPPLRMFEFTPLAVIFLVLGLVYVLAVGRKVLPPRVDAVSLASRYNLSSYLTELEVPPDSRIIGKSCRDLQVRERYGVSVLTILRGKEKLVYNIATTPLQEGDVLIVEGELDDVLRLKNEQRVNLLADMQLDDDLISEQGQVIVEGLITPTSQLIGQTLKESNFRRSYGAHVLAIRRHGETIYSRLAETPLRTSDTVLLMGTEERLRQMQTSGHIQLISEVETALHREKFWWLPLVLFPIIVSLAVFGVIEIMLGALVSVVLILLMGVMTNQETYRSIEWSVIFLIAAFVPVGEAMVRTGTAEFLAGVIFNLAHRFPDGWEAHATLALIYLITSLMTQMISNNAAAIILTPVALSVGATLSVDPRPFLVALCFAASAEFMTPMGYQTNMMVYGPGGYRFLDYVRFGAPLNLTLWILSSLLIPVLWPFSPA